MIRKNKEIIEKIVRAEFHGETKAERKPLYVEQNAFDVDIDVPIFRIFQLEYLKEDIEGNYLTHVKASPKTWGDPFENPLLNFQYKEGKSGEVFTLDGIMGNIFALSWTDDDAEDKDSWAAFSHGQPSVRLKTTPRKLLDRLMNLDDDFFMLRHYIGRVQYYAEKEIKEWRSKTHFTSHLDSLGQGIVLSLMALRNFLSREKEVRLVYTYMPADDSPWVKANVKILDDLCKLPFLWAGIIEEVIVGPYVPDGGGKQIEDFLSVHSIMCDTKDSIFRIARG